MKLVMAVAIMLSISFNVFAGDSTFMGFYKGSLREAFPNALYVDDIYISNSSTSFGLGIGAVDFYQQEQKNYKNAFREKAIDSCSSTYSAIDHFEIQLAFNASSNFMIAATCNVVCFNLPAKNDESSHTSKKDKKNSYLNMLIGGWHGKQCGYNC